MSTMTAARVAIAFSPNASGKLNKKVKASIDRTPPPTPKHNTKHTCDATVCGEPTDQPDDAATTSSLINAFAAALMAPGDMRGGLTDLLMKEFISADSYCWKPCFSQHSI